MLIGTAHGERLANIIKNPVLSDLVCHYSHTALLFSWLCIRCVLHPFIVQFSQTQNAKLDLVFICSSHSFICN